MNEKKTFFKKNILITGAASGIGKILTDKISLFDCDLILLDINEESLNGIKECFSERVARIHIFNCDLADTESLNRTCNEIKNKFQHVDILFNNAGIVFGKSILETSQNEIKKTFQVNTLAPIYLIKHFLGSMLERNEGHIINMSSASAYSGVPRLADYASSKAAIANFNDSLRLEIKEKKSNIITTLISPYYINTGMFEGVKTRFSFLLPILSPDYVAERVYLAVVKKESRVIMPLFIYTVFLIKILPASMFDSILRFFGINASMDEFTGR